MVSRAAVAEEEGEGEGGEREQNHRGVEIHVL